MIDHLFSAALTFCLLAAGTAAIASLMVGAPVHKHAQVRTIELPRVVVTGHRQAASATVARAEAAEPATPRAQ